VLDSGKFLISANAGPSPMAGKLCNKNFFSTSWQNDQTPMALGQVMNQQGIKTVYIMAPNYAAGKDMVTGFERTFKGKVVGKDLTKWGADAQLDFSAELAKARASKAEAIFVFYPGAAGPAFIKQYQQSGLNKTTPLYSTFTVDALSLPRLQKANLQGVLGSRTTQEWDPTLDNPANKKFVADYKKKYGGYPSYYGAQAYDAIMLIASAVKAVGGDVSNPDKVRAALKAAKFDSVRGGFRYGTNHFPIQNFYLREVVKDSEGNWSTKVIATVFKNHVDPYASQCKM
jgi:branched-chain amino acid transport system substrate-binding protein